MAGRGGEILYDALFEAFDQCTFTTFAIFKQWRVAAVTEDINGFRWAFFIGFCHVYNSLGWKRLLAAYPEGVAKRCQCCLVGITLSLKI